MNKKEEKVTSQLSSTQIECIRNACIEAAREGFMDASMSGLCMEGAIEAAIGSIQSLDISQKIKESPNDD
ncbi:acetyltransferase [Gracilimonas sp. BCB1]|uniref:acetyltransferase n=1 Tax=Gracilimonas sp. BCB1 TaxID=3152362 RepID=UPI0032D8E853